MANFRMGYIGKSFTLGILGIVGTLVACGGGGVTSTIASVATPPSPYILFASSFMGKAGATGEPYVVSGEGGDVFSFAGGGLRTTGAWKLMPCVSSVKRQACSLLTRQPSRVLLTLAILSKRLKTAQSTHRSLESW